MLGADCIIGCILGGLGGLLVELTIFCDVGAQNSEFRLPGRV